MNIPALPRTSDISSKPKKISTRHLEKQNALLKELQSLSHQYVIELPGLTRFCDVKDWANVNHMSYLQIENGRFTILEEENIHGETMDKWEYNNRGWYERAMPANLGNDGRVVQKQPRYGSYHHFVIDRDLVTRFSNILEKQPELFKAWVIAHSKAREPITNAENALIDCFKKIGAPSIDRTHYAIQWGLAELKKHNPALDHITEMVQAIQDKYAPYISSWRSLGVTPLDQPGLTDFNFIQEAAAAGWQSHLSKNNPNTETEISHT